LSTGEPVRDLAWIRTRSPRRVKSSCLVCSDS